MASASLLAALTCSTRFGMRGLLLLFAPFAKRDEMFLQALDGIAQRPRLGFVGRAIARGIVARGMAFGAIGVVLDQRGAEIGARALRRPLRRRIDGEEIVAVHAQRRQAVADAARGEGRFVRRPRCPRSSKSPIDC